MDDFIADFAVGLSTDFIKSGSPVKEERMVKYSRLLEIEREIYLRSAIKFFIAERHFVRVNLQKIYFLAKLLHC